MDFSNYKFHCNSFGYIMTEPKGKSFLDQYNTKSASYKDKIAKIQTLSDNAVKTKEKLKSEIAKLKTEIEELSLIKNETVLSETCKTHLADIYVAEKYKRHEDIKSKYLEKGLHMEEEAITLYSDVVHSFHKKNKTRKENDYLTGEVDIYSDGNYVGDTKVNWSIFQFTRAKIKPLLSVRRWQIKGYMWLWEVEIGLVINCLINTPDHLVKAEERRLMYDLVGRPDFTSEEEKQLYGPALVELRHNHNYDDIPKEDRVHIFQEVRNELDEEKIANRVIQCREYLNQLDQNKIKVYDTED